MKTFNVELMEPEHGRTAFQVKADMLHVTDSGHAVFLKGEVVSGFRPENVVMVLGPEVYKVIDARESHADKEFVWSDSELEEASDG